MKPVFFAWQEKISKGGLELVGKEGKGEPFDEVLDSWVPDDPQEEEWQWETEIKKQKIRKRRVPEGKEGGASKKRQGGSLRKKG